MTVLSENELGHWVNMSSGTGLSECFLPSSKIGQDQLWHLSVPAGTNSFEYTFAVCLSSSKVEARSWDWGCGSSISWLSRVISTSSFSSRVSQSSHMYTKTKIRTMTSHCYKLLLGWMQYLWMVYMCHIDQWGYNYNKLSMVAMEITIFPSGFDNRSLDLLLKIIEQDENPLVDNKIYDMNILAIW